jgi:hypothetical protein
VCRQLAHLVVKDGEGAQKFIAVSVTGAVSDDSARRVGLAIANSPLVKTAIAGEDANWGRVVMAVGKAGEPADRDSCRSASAAPGRARRPAARRLRRGAGRRASQGPRDRRSRSISASARPRHGVDLRPDPRLHLDQRGLPLVSDTPARGGARAAARRRERAILPRYQTLAAHEITPRRPTTS